MASINFRRSTSTALLPGTTALLQPDRPTGRSGPKQIVSANSAESARAETIVPRFNRLRRVRAYMLVLPVDALLLLTPALWTPSQLKAIAVMTAISLLLINSRGRYRARLHISVLDDLPGLLGNMLTAAAIVATAIAIRHEQAGVTLFLRNAAIALLLVVVGRIVTAQLILFARSRRITVHRTLLIGSGRLGQKLHSILADEPRYGLSVVGFVEDRPQNVATYVVPWLGDLSRLDQIVLETEADVLLVTDGTLTDDQLRDAVRTPACLTCDLLVVPRMPDFSTQVGHSRDHIGSIPIMRISTPNLHGVTWGIKRAFDIVVASALLVLASPLLLACAVAVRLDGGPGIIFRQTRVGRHGQRFDCLKLRSMRPSDPTDSATTWSIANDDRVTPIGRFMRRTSIDELPQLWNIIRGDMTLVGPRPERPHFVEQFTAQYDGYHQRHRVRAGLTGLAQVSGLRGDTSIADRARFDNYYIENWSLWLDTKILLRTFFQVLLARGR